MKKRLFAILVSVSLLSTMVLSGCGQNSTDEKVTSGVIRIAYNNIENYPHYKGLERAAQEIEDRSDGRFTVKIYSNGHLEIRERPWSLRRTMQCRCVLPMRQW